MRLFFRGLLFLLALNLLDNNVLFLKSGFLFPFAYAEEVKPPKVGPGEASYPECGSDVGLGLIGLIAGVVGGMILLFSSGGLMIMVALGMIVGAIVAAMQLVGCLWSFVRNPVLRTTTGGYRYCQDDTEASAKGFCPEKKRVHCDTKSTDAINKNATGCTYAWPRNRAENGKYIEICYREPFDWGYITRAGQETDLDGRESKFTAINLGVLGQNQSLEKLLDMKKKVSVRSITCVTLKHGESHKIGPYTYSAEYDGSKLCGYVTFTRRAKVGCHLRDPVGPAPMCIKSKPIYEQGDQGRIIGYDNDACFNCYISSACYGVTGLLSKAKFPMTSLVVQCIRESLRNILVSDCKGGDESGFLISAQKKMKSAVEAVLVLAVLLFGFKLLTGGVGGPQEWIIFAVKIAAIAYFTIGEGMIVYYDRLLDLSTGLADIVASAGGKQDICDFKSADYNQLVVVKALTRQERVCLEAFYRSGRNQDISQLGEFIKSGRLECSNLTPGPDGNYAVFSKVERKNLSYLSLWDRLDCRIAFYLGSSLGNPSVGVTGVATSMTAGAISAMGGGIFIVPVLILALLFAGQVLIALLVLSYVILMLLIILWITHLFILSIVALTILILFSPIFIPMLLFQVTKPFFEGWLKEVMAYSLYPIVLFGFLALVFSVFDKLYFDDLLFKRVVERDGVRSYFSYKLANPGQCNETDADGELRKFSVLACIIDGMALSSKPLVFGIYVTSVGVDTAATNALWVKLGVMALMLFLFFHFLGILGGLAAELVGNFRADLSRYVSNPQTMARKLIAASLNTTKGVADAAKNVSNKARGVRSTSDDGTTNIQGDNLGEVGRKGDMGGGGGAGGAVG